VFEVRILIPTQVFMIKEISRSLVRAQVGPPIKNKRLKMELNDIKKDLYKSKAMAKLSHYVSGNLYYIVELTDGVYQFPISTVEVNTEIILDVDVELMSLSSDLGTTTFESEMKGSDMNRWIAKAVEKGEFIKIS
jgi:hypothetical protein